MPIREVDVAIVGSGAGGGTVAAGLAPLARAGARIVVLEQGPRLEDREFTGRELEMARRLYVESGGFFTADRTVSVAMGRAYGGSTVVYTGVTLPVPRHVIERWAVPGLEWEDLSRRSEAIAEGLNVHELPEEAINENNAAFARGCRELGWALRRIPLNVRGCRGAGLCNLGCPNGAKMGTHRVQLPEAEAAGVEVVTGCRVERVGEQELEAVVTPQAAGRASPWPVGRYTVRAKVVVLAGNAVATPSLLLRSGFGRRFPALGRGLTMHPAMVLTGVHPRELSNFYGHPKSWYTDEFQRTHRFLLEVCMYYPFTTSRNLIGFGRELAEAMAAYRRMQQILVLVQDEPEERNRVRVGRRGETVLDYRLSKATLDALHTAMLRGAELMFAGGADRVHVPAARRFWLERSDAAAIEAAVPRDGVVPGRIAVSSAHPMGGCRMGGDLETSVTDAWGRVHGVPWLFVADSSLFPRCSEVNPYLTVMALADRVAERIRTEQKELM